MSISMNQPEMDNIHRLASSMLDVQTGAPNVRELYGLGRYGKGESEIDSDASL